MLTENNKDFYPRPPGGGRLARSCPLPCRSLFLSTPSGWRATSRVQLYLASLLRFLSTPSGWRATAVLAEPAADVAFLSTPSGWRATIPYPLNVLSGTADFYPRPPGGGRRRKRRLKQHLSANFYPRPPGGGRRLVQVFSGTVNEISIHALRVEGDRSCLSLLSFNFYFYPRPPGGGRHDSDRLRDVVETISIHALRVEGDSKNGQSFRLFLRKREKNLPL